MPSRYEIVPARPDHSEGLCRLFREAPMSGGIAVAMEREPDYFLGAAVHAERSRVIVAEKGSGADREVVAGASLAERPVYVAGAARDIPFLGDVRIHPDHRRGTLLGRMVRHAREQAWLETGFAQSIVVRDNVPALELMGMPRGGGPRFFPAGDYASPAIRFGRLRPSLEGRFRVRKAVPEDLPAMQAFLDRESPAKEFYPCYRLSELGSSPYYRGLAWEDFYLAFERKEGKAGENGRAGEELAGITGLWDQAAFKQTRIVAYRGAVRILRPFYNLLSPMIGRPGLPPPGSALPSLCLHTVCTRGNDAGIFSVLVRRILNDFSGSKYAYLLCGFDARDPLLPVLRAYPHQDFGGRHFLVAFDGRLPEPIRALEGGKLFYLEAARI